MNPPMVLLHALGENGNAWKPVRGSFARSFHVFSLDLRGHGDSGKTEVYSFDAMCDDVLDLLDQLTLKPITLIGHSMGGVVAYLVAMHKPELVSHLVIEDVSPPYKRDQTIPDPPDNTDSLGFDWEVVPAIVAEVNAGNPQTWADLKTIQAPTLLIGGGPDSHIPQDKLLEVAQRIPGCDLITIATGHHGHTSEPGAFVNAVVTWLQA